jgi:hypothetical protein
MLPAARYRKPWLTSKKGDEEVEVEVSVPAKEFRVCWWNGVWTPEYREELHKHIDEDIIRNFEMDAPPILSELKINPRLCTKRLPRRQTVFQEG